MTPADFSATPDTSLAGPSKQEPRELCPLLAQHELSLTRLCCSKHWENDLGREGELRRGDREVCLSLMVPCFLHLLPKV